MNNHEKLNTVEKIRKGKLENWGKCMRASFKNLLYDLMSQRKILWRDLLVEDISAQSYSIAPHIIVSLLNGKTFIHNIIAELAAALTIAASTLCYIVTKSCDHIRLNLYDLRIGGITR